jgi:formylglycine-generating enzyme required for sulfatase activity
MVGTTIGHYTIEAVLGRGGMGTVYRARDTQLNRTVALKVLDETRGDPAARVRLVHEARAASALNHPNVVTVHAVEQQPDFDFIVMEWIAGTPLTEAIPAGGLPLDTFLDYAVQMTSALAAAHDAGIVHRDIKPANISITATGLVKVFDFGIARRISRPEDETQQLTVSDTGRGAVITGTPGYMAPEQVQGIRADARSDVFSTGVVMYEMLTGRQPFAGESAWARIDATLHREPVAPGAVRADVPSSVDAVVRRCLAKSPDSRYASAKGLLEDLSRIRAQRSGDTRTKSRAARLIAATAVVLALLAVGALAWYRVREGRVRWARESGISEARRLAAAGEPLGAYRMLQRALAYAPKDPQVNEAWIQLTHTSRVTSEPTDAEVSVRAYGADDEGWLTLGKTPVVARTPVGQLRWRFSKAGYETIEISPEYPAVTAFLPRAGAVPPGMVHVPPGSVEVESDNSSIELPEYFIDRFEVTNREYKAFVDAGGYSRPEYWTEAFADGTRTLPREGAMKQFHDATGRPGPSTWELGSYPEGQADFPVGGVSWYEAAAYARYAGKQLPPVYHWQRASGAFGVFSEIIRFSNFSGKGPSRVGVAGGLGPYGTYDMAGNVKEWCWNATADGKRYVLGGGWNEANYLFRDPDARLPFDRSASNGVRLIRPVAAVDHKLLAPIAELTRDPAKLRPVDDEIFAAYRRLYDYDPAPLEPRMDGVEESSHWRLERVSFRAAYGSERVPAQLLIPRTATPPYQAVIYFPGSDAVMLQSSRDLWLQWVEFIVRSGRVLVYPIYQQTYERRRQVTRGPNFLREISLQRGQDMRRTVDYLATRTDIDAKRLAFYGLSLGAQLGPVFLAIEPRLRTGVLLSGGFETWDMPPETDPVNFAPRVKQPVLMVNGREDFDLPYETAQVPLFRALGSSVKDHKVLEGGHIPPRPQEVFRLVLDWLDAQLGPVGH